MPPSPVTRARSASSSSASSASLVAATIEAIEEVFAWALAIDFDAPPEQGRAAALLLTLMVLALALRR